MRLTRTVALAAALLPALLAPAHAHTPDGTSFVAAFRQACVPRRLSYEGMRELASSLGWLSTVPGSNPELGNTFALADRALEKEGRADWTYDRAAYERIVAGKLHHLVVSRIDAPGITRVISCALYDFGATASIDPSPITDLVGAPGERSFDNYGLTAHSWGDSPAMPGTFQTVLTFVAEDSRNIVITGFSGLVLKIDSTDPNAAKAGSE